MKTLLASLFAALLAGTAVMAHAAPLGASTDVWAPLSDSHDKDKKEEKKD
jgi:hypothetical protein